MAGLTGKKAAGPSKTSSKTVNKAGGGVGGKGSGNVIGGGPPVQTCVQYTWVVNAANPNQMIVTFAQPVVFAGGVPQWTVITGTNPTTCKSAVANTTTQATLTFNSAVNSPVAFLSIPQNDPSFRGAQGQFVQPGLQAAGPQKLK